jgi:tRNA threonylcarbamoyladenosine biosynthesis protein TsaB
VILGFDTATAATTVAWLGSDGAASEARHDPEEGERPRHGSELLGLIDRVMGLAGSGWDDVDRLVVGLGPGSFTGLRIGVATARALAQARGITAVSGVSTLAALAAGVSEAYPGRPVTAVIDARRGEVFAAAFGPGGDPLGVPEALAPEVLATRLAGTLAAGDGSVRFRAELEAGGADIPPEDSPVHRVSAIHVCRLGAEAQPVPPDALLPHYIRAPDAEMRKPRT